MNATNSYIPDHIRLKRTDRLVHVRDSLRLVYRRFLPTLWEDQNSYDTCTRLSFEIALIDAELHKRYTLTRVSQRSMRNPAYIENWS